MKILYYEKSLDKGCNYYSNIRDYLSINNKIKIIKNNLKKEIINFNPDIIIIGFTVTNTNKKPTLNLNNIKIPLYIILNKEYQALNEKLDWIKEIDPPPRKVFSVHHDIKKYTNYCNVPFFRIMWSADEKIFKKYSNIYNYDLFFSGVIRKEQTSNMRNKIYDKLYKLNNYRLLIKAAFYENNKFVKGKIYQFTNLEYAKKIEESKIILTTTGPADLVGTRYFEIMASNKGLIICNRMPEEVYGDIVIDKFNCVMFDDENDFIEKCKYYLENEEERLKIVNNAYNYFLKKHTWNQKVKDLLNNL